MDIYVNNFSLHDRCSIENIIPCQAISINRGMINHAITCIINNHGIVSISNSDAVH